MDQLIKHICLFVGNVLKGGTECKECNNDCIGDESLKEVIFKKNKKFSGVIEKFSLFWKETSMMFTQSPVSFSMFNFTRDRE